MRPSPSPIPSRRGKMTEEGTVPHQECQGGRGSPQRPGRCSVLGVELGRCSQIGPGPCHIHMRPHVSMPRPHVSTCVHVSFTGVHTCPHVSTCVHVSPTHVHASPTHVHICPHAPTCIHTCPCHIHAHPHVFTPCLHLSTHVHTHPHGYTCVRVCLTISFKERFESLFIPYRNLTLLTS